jgi:hypothetical protein
VDFRNPAAALQKSSLPSGQQAKSSFNLNPLMMSQSNNKIVNSGHSPQPQIRIRTETYKSKPSNDLAKYEERLQEHALKFKLGNGPQHGSSTHNYNHRSSNKKLP